MKKLLESIICLLFFFLPLSVRAGVELHQNVTVAKFVYWSSADPTYIQLSNSKWCFIPASDTKMYSLILSKYTAKTAGDFWCYDTASYQNFDGFSGGRIYKILGY